MAIDRQDALVVEKSAVIVGSGGCGKTCILHRIVTNTFSREYVPTIFEDSIWRTSVENKKVVMLLKDTAGQEDYDRLISLAVTGADIIMLCYSVDDRRSFEDIRNKYIHVIPQADLKRAEIALVGNKTDLRMGTSGFVTRREAEALAEEVNARWVFEVSAKHNDGIHEMFGVFALWSSETALRGRKRSLFARLEYFLACSCCKPDADVEPEF